MSVASINETEIAEAMLIDLADKAGVERRMIQLALKISERTYYRRRQLPALLRSERDEEAYTREEAGCS